jgi:hypothetical protein
MAGVNWAQFLGKGSDIQGMAEEAAADEFVNLEPEELARKGTAFDPGKEQSAGDSILEAGTKRTTNVTDIDNDDLRIPMRDRLRMRNTLAMVPNEESPVEIEEEDGETVATVRTENVSSREFNAFTKYIPAGTANAPGQPVLLLGQDYGRDRALLTTPIIGAMVGKKTDIAAGEGFYLPANVPIETKIKEEIYACAAINGAATQVSVWVERD